MADAVVLAKSKDMPWTHQGLDNLRYSAGLLPLPVVGIGGISMDNVAAVGATGAASAAVISAITQSPDPAAACRALVRGFGGG